MQEYFKIGEISRLYGIGVDSLRYYEKIGILSPERGESGYRHYSIRDIWKLNIIRDLRELGFGMEQIRQYLLNHTVDSTLELLQQEQQAIGEKILALQALQKNVEQRMAGIRQARQQIPDVISLQSYPPRRCYAIAEGYSEEHEMDVLIKRLINLDRENLYVIGCNQIGTAISGAQIRKDGRVRYVGVFVIDPKGKQELPGGRYLTVTYRGDYQKTEQWIEKLSAYAEACHIRLQGDFLEILHIDIHTTSRVEEYVTELQILAVREENSK